MRTRASRGELQAPNLIDPARAPEPAGSSLPGWLTKELHRAGVSDDGIDGLDVDAARDLIAEIRSEEVE